MPPTDDARNLCASVRESLRQWRQHNLNGSTLSHLLLHGQFMRAHEYSPQRAAAEVLLQALEQLKTRHPDEAELLQLRFLDNHPVSAMANRRNVAESTIYVQQRQAIARLCEVVAAMEAELIAERRQTVNARLGAPSYGETVGIDEAVAQLAPLLGSDEPPWLISIEGIGGIGKTTLADVLVRTAGLHPRFDGVAWVSAQPSQLLLDGSLHALAGAATSADAVAAALSRQVMPEEAARFMVDPAGARRALGSRLMSHPHLLVVDNLETIEDLDQLVPLLAELANPSRILLTARKRYEGEFALYHFLVPELSEQHALDLVRQEARRINLPLIEGAADDDLRPIYAAVGGNPLALRLLTGQLHHYGLDALLADLRHARGESIENLYTFIYRRAWDALAERERRLLLAMPLTPVEREAADFIGAVSGLERDELRAGLAGLVRLNLVNVGGDLQRRRYSIHSLTRTFLHEQVARWQ